MTEFNVDDYHNWLYKLAADYLPGGVLDSEIDDLVQEGRIAMWKSSLTHDPEKGAQPAWLTRAAVNRMKDISHGHGRWTGHTGRRGVTDAMSPHAPRPLSLDSLLSGQDDEGDYDAIDERRLRPCIAKSKRAYA